MESWSESDYNKYNLCYYKVSVNLMGLYKCPKEEVYVMIINVQCRLCLKCSTNNDASMCYHEVVRYGIILLYLCTQV